MPAPAPHKSQRIRVKSTDTYFHVRVSNATNCDTRHLPTPDELLTRTVDKPGGYTYVDLNCAAATGIDASYTFSRAGTDFLGRSFVTAPAPYLTSVARSKPRIRGNYYLFPVQTAQNAALHKRIPLFTIHPSKIIIYPGGLYTDPADSEMIGRGYTHLAENMSFTPGQPFPTQYKRAIERPYYEAAGFAANEAGIPLADRNELLAWQAVPHVLLTRDSAARLYAKYWVNIFEQADTKGGGVEYFSVNHEVFQGNYQQYYQHSGLMTRAIVEEMESRFDGTVRRYPNPKSGLSDFGALVTFSPGDRDTRATGFSDIMNANYSDPDASVPAWLHYQLGLVEPYSGISRANPISDSSILGQLLKSGKAYAGSGSYNQHTNDDQTMFLKNADGSYTLDNAGWMQWRTDARTTVINGEACPIYGDDYKTAIKKLYGYFCQFYAMNFFRAGSQHLPMSTARANGWDNLKFLAQYRLDTEAVSGSAHANPESFNQRPLNAEWTKTYGMAMYIYVDYIRGWMNTQQQTALGASTTNNSKSRASSENYASAFQRAAGLNWIHDTPYQHVQPKFWCFEQATNYYEQFWTKPLLPGGIATYLGKPTVWINWSWPCQDVDRTTDVVTWFDKGAGPVTPSYKISLVGREPVVEWWHLPAEAVATGVLEPKHQYYQFRNFKNELVTWRGDYREARITTHPTPPALA